MAMTLRRARGRVQIVRRLTMHFENRHFTRLENPRKEAVSGICRFREIVPVEFDAFALRGFCRAVREKPPHATTEDVV